LKWLVIDRRRTAVVDITAKHTDNVADAVELGARAGINVVVVVVRYGDVAIRLDKGVVGFDVKGMGQNLKPAIA